MNVAIKFNTAAMALKIQIKDLGRCIGETTEGVMLNLVQEMAEACAVFQGCCTKWENYDTECKNELGEFHLCTGHSVIDGIRDMKAAIEEAGSAKPLRFVKVDAFWWMVRADDPTKRIVFRNADDQLVFAKFLTKEPAIEFAESLGLTAEFVEGE